MDCLDIPLDFYNDVPDEFLKLDIRDVRKVFANPSLVHLKGKKRGPLFLSVLLHGNEESSFFVLQKLVEFSKKEELPRDLIIFIGNVYATEQSRRYLNDQTDYNRVWSGGDSKEHRLAQQVLDKVKSLGPLFACIDIHNNAGVNPYYGCINTLDEKYIHLASLFSQTLVYFINPSTVLSLAFSKLAPTVTIECGLSRDAEGIDKAFEFVLKTLNLDNFEAPIENREQVKVFHTVGKIQIEQGVDFTFSTSLEKKLNTLVFPLELEQFNFNCLDEGFVFASYDGSKLPLKVLDDDGDDRASDYFLCDESKILIKNPFYPSMLTTNKKVIQQDCLGYFMEKIKI